MALSPQATITHQLRSLQTMQEFRMVVPDGHFDFGNGYHGNMYLMPDRVRARPDRAMELVRELMELLPSRILRETEVVFGPSLGGTLVATLMTVAIDAQQAMHFKPDHEIVRIIERERDDEGKLFVPKSHRLDLDEHDCVKEGKDKGKRVIFVERTFSGVGTKNEEGSIVISPYISDQIVRGRKVMVVDDVKNTGKTLWSSVNAVRLAGGQVLATAVLFDRLREKPEFVVREVGESDPRPRLHHYALAELEDDSQIWPADQCPLCRVGAKITKF